MAMTFPSSATDFYGDFESQQAEIERQRALAAALYKNVIGGANQNAQATGPYNGMMAFLGQALGGLGLQQSEKDLSAKQEDLVRRRDAALKDYVSNWPTDTPGSRQYEVPSASVGLPDFIGGPTQPEQQALRQVTRQESLAYALKGAGLGQFGNKIAEAAVAKSLNPEKRVFHVEEVATGTPGETVKVVYDDAYNPVKTIGNVKTMNPTELMRNADDLVAKGMVNDKKDALSLLLGKDSYTTINGNLVPTRAAEISGLGVPGTYNQPQPASAQTPQSKLLPQSMPLYGDGKTQESQAIFDAAQRQGQTTPEQPMLPQQTISAQSLPPVPKKLGDAVIPDPQYSNSPGGATEFGRPLTGVYAQKPLPAGSVNMDPTNKEGLQKLYADAQKLQDERRKGGIDDFEHWVNEAEKMFARYGDKPIPGLGYLGNVQLSGVGRDEAQQNQLIMTNLANAFEFAQGGKNLTANEIARVTGGLGITAFQNEQTAREAVDLTKKALQAKDASIGSAYAPEAVTLVKDRLNFGKAQAAEQEKATKPTAATTAGKQPLSAMPNNLTPAEKLRWMENNWNLVDDR